VTVATNVPPMFIETARGDADAGPLDLDRVGERVLAATFRHLLALRLDA
jgi:hypothetical protein